MFYGEKKEKSEIARLCKTISELAEDGDELSLWIFSEAGKELAKFIQSLYPGADKVRYYYYYKVKKIVLHCFKYSLNLVFYFIYYNMFSILNYKCFCTIYWF